MIFWKKWHKKLPQNRFAKKQGGFSILFDFPDYFRYNLITFISRKMNFPNKNKRIIIDADTGIDDALAIILLSKYIPENILGITTCGGNVGVNQTTKNSLAILSLLGLKIPVFKGSKKPLKEKSYIPAYDYQGKNGLCNINLPNSLKPQRKSASDFIIESAKKYKNDLIIISLAPLTNIAEAILKNEKTKKYLKNIFIMGGAIRVPGNQTKYAEFNFFQDPDSAKIVFESIAKIRLIPLDVTNKCVIGKKEIKKFKNGKMGSFASAAIKNWYGFFGNQKKREFELYDPLVAGALLGNFLNFKKIKVKIVTEGSKKGQLLKDEKGLEIECALKVKNKEFQKFFFESINAFRK